MAAADRMPKLPSIAALTMRRGVHYEPAIKHPRVHAEVPPPHIAPIGPKAPRPGERFGRFTVIGQAPCTNPKKNCSYVVRCACGRYEHRKARAIRNPANRDDRCARCVDLDRLRQRDRRPASRPPLPATSLGGSPHSPPHTSGPQSRVAGLPGDHQEPTSSSPDLAVVGRWPEGGGETSGSCSEGTAHWRGEGNPVAPRRVEAAPSAVPSLEFPDNDHEGRT